MNRKCRQPSRQGFRCGGRERPSGCSVMGTSAMRKDFNVALITISEANSMPVVFKFHLPIGLPGEPAQPAMEIPRRASEE